MPENEDDDEVAHSAMEPTRHMRWLRHLGNYGHGPKLQQAYRRIDYNAVGEIVGGGPLEWRDVPTVDVEQ